MQRAWFESSDPHGDGWHVRLDALDECHTAYRLADVIPVLARAEQAAHAGKWAAVVVAYEAAAAFEPVLAERVAPPIPGLPLVWVGIANRSGRSGRSDRSSRSERSGRLKFTSKVERTAFVERARRVQEYIRAGDTYQVNLTFQVTGPGAPDYHALREAQQARYCADIDLGTHRVISLSPELFFSRAGSRLTTRPMKGTAPRGRWQAEDEAIAAALAGSAKERAENVMIVDMLRNDVGRVARAGTVRVPELFTVERYPTLWQMTSTVEGEISRDTTLVDIFRALFPCGSVTGAPKLRTMEIIAELEQEPRGLYTGAIGLVQPDGDCIFSVAIRTIVVDTLTGIWSMGVGAGITADSIPEIEYQECVLKSAFLAEPAAAGGSDAFELLETMRLENGDIARLERHLVRIRRSAAYFGFAWNEVRVRGAIDQAIDAHPSGCWRMRLLVDREGLPAITCTPHPAGDERRWRVALATSAVDDRDPFLFNKTTRRHVYDEARRQRPDADDVLLWNARNEVTEATFANIVAEIDGVRVTPPVTSGLLPGTFREELLERGLIRERVVTREDLIRASRLWLTNSVRGWIEATLIS